MSVMSELPKETQIFHISKEPLFHKRWEKTSPKKATTRKLSENSSNTLPGKIFPIPFRENYSP